MRRKTVSMNDTPNIRILLKKIKEKIKAEKLMVGELKSLFATARNVFCQVIKPYNLSENKSTDAES
jgi:sulfur relay (sulfurtransferase) DsrC/TusE family protein